MSDQIIIENGWLIDPKNNKEGEFDLLIEQGKIKEVKEKGAFKSNTSAKRIDAKGKWVTPGLIDLHVHLREPGFEWKETIATGADAAVAGGFTSICCMPNTEPVNDEAEITKYILDKAKAASKAKVFPIAAISMGLKGKTLAPYSELAKAGAVAFSDDGKGVQDGGLMRRALEWCQMLGMRLCCHEECNDLNCGGSMNESAISTRMGLNGMPALAEEVMIARDIELAKTVGGKIHICHISTARGVEMVRRAKVDGVDITAEVCPHHLFMSEQLFVEEGVPNYDTNYKMSPPLRSGSDNLALIEGIADGTIDAIASDHAPHENDSKNKEFDAASFGIIGLQTTLPLTLQLVKSKKLTKMQLINLLTAAPAKVLNLPVGSLSEGAAADIAIIDSEKEWMFDKETNRSKSTNSPYFGKKLVGQAVTVLVDGKVIFE